MKLPNLFSRLDAAVARHVTAALADDHTPPSEDFAAEARAQVETPKGGRNA